MVIHFHLIKLISICFLTGKLWLNDDMQWRHPLSLSLTTPQTLTPSSPSTTQLNTNSNIPFRELLLQQQQQKEQQQQHHSDIKRNLENFSTIATNLAVAAAAANTAANSTNTMTVSATERDRNALASHFHERDRLILQHQQQKLQQQREKKQQLQRIEQDREKCLNNNDRIHDYVSGVDRERTNSRSRKSLGKPTKIVI